MIGLHDKGRTSFPGMHTAAPVLLTERLMMRHMNADLADAQFLVRLLNDPSWLRFIGDRGVHSNEDAQHYVSQAVLPSYGRFGYGHYLVQSRSSGRPLGLCGLVKRDYLDDPDLGYALLPEYRGQGYAYEAASAMLMHAIQFLRIARILATTRTENRISHALLLKLGFRFERMIRHPEGDRDLELFAYTPTPIASHLG